MGSKNTDLVARKEWRKKLKRWGMKEDAIERCMAQIKERQQMKKNGILPLDSPLCIRAEYVRLLKQQSSVDPKSVAVLQLGNDYEQPDDKGFKPPRVDPVLTGVARATGMTAKAVKRKKALTKWEYDLEVSNGK